MFPEDAYYRPEGLLRIPAFMPADYCEKLRLARQAVPAAPAGYVTAGGIRHDEDIRKTSAMAVPDRLLDAFTKKLEGMRERLSDTFALSWEGWNSRRCSPMAEAAISRLIRTMAKIRRTRPTCASAPCPSCCS